MAADVITRFRLETTQFDSKLRDTAKTLQDIARTAQSGGKNFNDFSKKSIEAARALGTVQSGATNTKDKLKDLVGSFNDAAKAYNSLNETAKKGEFGKALEASLQKLQQDIKQTKEELYGLGDAVKSKSGGLFGNLGDKMGGAMQVFAGNVMTKIAGMGVELAGEMGEMITQGIELAKQGEGIRIAFERLGRGDILDGLRKATHGTVTDLELMKAAVKFNDFKLPLDELATMLSFAQQKAKDTGQSVDYLVESIVNGLGRQSTQILDNLGLSQSEVKRRTAEVGDMTKAVGEIIREQMSAAGDYVETAADRAAQAHVSLQNKMEELGRKFSPLQEASNNFWTSMKISILDIVGGPLTRLLNGLTEAGRLQNMLNSMNGEAGSGNTKVDQQLKKLNVIKKAGGSDYIFNSTLNGMMEDYNRQIMALDTQIKNGGKPVGGGSGSSQDVRYLQQKMDALKIMRDQLAAGAKELSKPVDVNQVKADIKTGGSSKTQPEYLDFYKALLKNESQNLKKEAPFQSVYAMLKGNSEKFDPESVLGSTDKWDAFKNTIIDDTAEIKDAFSNLNEWTKDFNPYEDLIEKENADLKKMVETATLASSALSGIGQAFASIEDPAAKVAGTIMQAIATIAMGYAQATLAAAQTGNPWVWVAFAASGLAQMVSMISTIHSSTGYQNGGVVKGYQHGGVVKGYAGGKPVMGYAGGGSIGSAISGGMVTGSTYSNDQIPIMANAGEVVLNSAQAGVIANRLNSQDRGIHIFGEIEGEKIILAANTTFKRKGEGEIVTW